MRDPSMEEAKEIQNRLCASVRLLPLTNAPKSIAGGDIPFGIVSSIRDPKMPDADAPRAPLRQRVSAGNDGEE